MKKLLYSLAGLLAGFIVIFYINVLLQYMAANLFLSKTNTITFNTVKLNLSFTMEPANFWGSFFVVLTPFISGIIVIEAALMLLMRRVKDTFNISLIIFQLVNIGFLLIFIVTGIVAVVLKNSVSNNFVDLLRGSSYSHNQQLIFVLIISAFFFGYLNIFLKRMRGGLPGIINNKIRKTDELKK